MTRKSPIRHHVRTYKRHSGTTVHDYNRGHGTRKHKVSRPRLSKPSQKQETNKYHVRIAYILSSESFPVTASTIPEAIDIGLMSRASAEAPMQVEVKRL